LALILGSATARKCMQYPYYSQDDNCPASDDRYYQVRNAAGQAWIGPNTRIIHIPISKNPLLMELLSNTDSSATPTQLLSWIVNS